MSKSNRDIEVYCPKCKKLFRNEESMLEHYYPEHERIVYKPEPKPVKVKKFFSLAESERIVRELESGWHVVKHGRYFEWTKSILRFELLRKPVLTNERLILLKDDESIDYELPITFIKSVECDTIGTGNILLRIELKNGDAISLFFGCPSLKILYGSNYLYGKANTLTNQWMLSINNLLLAQPKRALAREKMFCRYCGLENENDAIFCKKCGKKIA